MRMRSSATADDLREHAVDGIRVDERDLQAEQPVLRPLVDQLGALRLELVERRADVVDLVGDVVHAGTPFGEELADGRVVAERRQQLDPARAHAQRGRLDALVGHRLAMLDARPEEALVGRDGAVEVVDGDAQVMNAMRLHAAAMLPGHSAATTRTVPTVSDARDSTSTSPISSSSSARSSVSFSSSAFAMRSR